MYVVEDIPWYPETLGACVYSFKYHQKEAALSRGFALPIYVLQPKRTDATFLQRPTMRFIYTTIAAI
jgi:hypothetical protein